MLSMSKDEEICICIGTIIFSLVSILFSQVIKAKTLECVGVGINGFVFMELWDEDYEVGSWGDCDAVGKGVLFDCFAIQSHL